MAGRATLITDASMDAMLEPRTVAASTQRLACEAQPGVSGAPRMTPVSHGGDAMLSMRRQRRSQPNEPRRDPEPLGAGAAEHRDRYAGSNQRARFETQASTSRRASGLPRMPSPHGSLTKEGQPSAGSQL